ncbi:MAG: phosphoribosylglycinamide formyltransferase [Metallibacterium sp.]
MPRTPGTARLAVLVSGRGSNFDALRAAIAAGQLHAEIALVASNRPHAPALARARAAGIATHASESRGSGDRAAWDRAFMAAVAAAQPDLIVLAGFMRRLDAAAVTPWLGRMLNIHPSLLPKYPGLDTHQRVLDAGDVEHGASVHFVTAELDGGPVLAQVRMPVSAADTPHSLAARLLPLEHHLLVAAVTAVASGRCRMQGTAILCAGQILHAPLQLQDDASLA